MSHLPTRRIFLVSYLGSLLAELTVIGLIYGLLRLLVARARAVLAREAALRNTSKSSS